MINELNYYITYQIKYRIRKEVSWLSNKLVEEVIARHQSLAIAVQFCKLHVQTRYVAFTDCSQSRE
jgi:hypothetical protein